MKYYECKTCGNIMVLFEDAGVIPVCCGSTMVELTPQELDGAKEKHVPVILVNKNDVLISVGTQPHPMTSEHHIDWIVLETNKGMHVSYIRQMDETAMAGFTLQKGERVIAAYEHCNLHGLWMAEA